jgi:hypothetical protein
MHAIKWSELAIPKKKTLLKTYIDDIIKENQDDYINGKIDNLTNNKNILFLETLKKDKNFYKKIKDSDIIIENSNIYEIKSIVRTDDGLICYLNTIYKSKLIDFEYKIVKNYITHEKKNLNINYI